MLGFGPFCLDLDHIAWIWAILQNLGQNRPQMRQSPEDGAGGMDVCMDVRTDGQFPPCSLGSLPKTDFKWTEMAQNDQNVKVLIWLFWVPCRCPIAVTGHFSVKPLVYML